MFLFYNNKVLDVNYLLYNHPGGARAITNYSYKDVAKIFFNVYKHPKESEKKLLDYTVGYLDNWIDEK